MQESTIKKLVKARQIADVPFIINSAYRTPNYNSKLKNSVSNSAHQSGYAVDISTTDQNQKKIASALVKAGFKRIGIGKNFVHADDDPNKPQNVSWGYPAGTQPAFNPFNLA